MFIHIPFEELERDVLNLFSSSEELRTNIFNLCIDYATNTVEGMNRTTRKEYVLFHFSNYDMYLANRSSDYKIEFVNSGVKIEIWNTREKTL